MALPSYASRDKRPRPSVMTFQEMQRFVGYLAFLLPVMVAFGYFLFGAPHPLDSISESYFTVLRDVFVGILCMVAFFMFAYKGYDKWEDWLYNLCGVLSLLIAGFSMNPQLGPPVTGSGSSVGWLATARGGDVAATCRYDIAMAPACLQNDRFDIYVNNRRMLMHYPWYGHVHLGCAALLFILLGGISLFLFTRAAQDRGLYEEPTPEKRKRNVVYRICGGIIWGALLVYVVYLVAAWVASENAIVVQLGGWILFAVEWVCLWAWGFAWLVKGEFLLKDKAQSLDPTLRAASGMRESA